jgi:hypothetical protein
MLAGGLALAPAAGARGTATLSLDVVFSLNGTISVTLPDGTPVGSTSGAPTVIPAGYYTLMLTGPGGCTTVPYFQLSGPGNDVLNNLDEGEESTVVENADFLPNSTYTWTDEANPNLVYTFSTSATVEGTPPPVAPPSGISAGVSSGKSASSTQDYVGSDIVPLRGTLSGTVGANGALSLLFKGRKVATLTAGRYTFTVADKSKTGGFVIEHGSRTAVSLTGGAFVGTHSASVELTAGQWSFSSGLLGKKTYFIVTS